MTRWRWSCKHSLRALEAEDQLFADVTSVGHLVDKLPTSSQERWDHHIRAFGEDCSPQRRGEIFDPWLEEEGGAVVKHGFVRWQGRNTEQAIPTQLWAPEEEPGPAPVGF